MDEYSDDDYYDDGWRNCEKCGKGFTLFHALLGYSGGRVNGHDDEGTCLCDECFKKYAYIDKVSKL